MSSNGRRLAFLIGIGIAFMLPKRVNCGYSAAESCSFQRAGRLCTPAEVEPWGFYLIELVVKSNVGFAYSHDDGC
jgi:hypothetical protein